MAFPQCRASLLSIVLVMMLSPAFANDLNNATWSETDASNNAASPNGWTSGTMTPVQIEPTGRAMMGAIKRWYDHANATVTSGGSANAQTLTYSVGPAALSAGDAFAFIVGFNNTSDTTLTINGTSAGHFKRGGNNLQGGELKASTIAFAMFDGTNTQLLATSAIPTPNSYQAQPSNPTGTTSTSTVMMGLAQAFTPKGSGVVEVTISGGIANSTTNDGTKAQIAYGTGTAPVNGDAFSGASMTTVGSPAQLISTALGGMTVPFSRQAVISGLTVGTAYWFDLGVAALTGGTASVGDLSVTIREL